MLENRILTFLIMLLPAATTGSFTTKSVKGDGKAERNGSTSE